MYVTLTMDVEDPIAPEADDAAQDCARILSSHGVTAMMCVTGDKARTLAARKRDDVIAALARHDIGLHTDLHSVHPTPAEYLADRGWDDGIVEAQLRERPGVTAIREVFGVEPSCWGGPGNTWGPQIAAALPSIGIPSYVYGHTRVPDGGPHRFAGAIAYPGGHGFQDSAYGTETAAADRARVAALLTGDQERGAWWSEVFLGHPTRIRSEEFWDAPNLLYGANPPRSEWRPARLRPRPAYLAALDDFARAVDAVASVPGVELRTIRQMNAALDGAPARPLGASERSSVAPDIDARLAAMSGWPVLPRDINLSGLRSQMAAHLDLLQAYDLARAIVEAA